MSWEEKQEFYFQWLIFTVINVWRWIKLTIMNLKIGLFKANITKCQLQRNPGKDWSVKFSHSVVSDFLWPHGLQHARPPCPSPTPGVYSSSCPLSWWCHLTISSSLLPFSSCRQSFPAYTVHLTIHGIKKSFFNRSLRESIMKLKYSGKHLRGLKKILVLR